MVTASLRSPWIFHQGQVYVTFNSTHTTYYHTRKGQVSTYNGHNGHSHFIIESSLIFKMNTATSRFRTDSMSLLVSQDKANSALEAVADSEFERVPLTLIRLQSVDRDALEKQHTKERVAFLEEELELERRKRRSADIIISQLKTQLNEANQQKSKQLSLRLDVEFEKQKLSQARDKVADTKRNLQEKYSDILKAYRVLVLAYEDLKGKYQIMKVQKALSLKDRARFQLHKVKDMFHQVQSIEDPDINPTYVIPILRSTALALPPLVSATCTICGDSDICKGYVPSPFSTLCSCGHDKRAHGLS